MMAHGTFEKGWSAEKKVRSFFEDQGFTCLAHRFKSQWGEIDLILQKDEQLIFVEVKRRKNLTHGLFSISPRQIQRISRAAEIFLGAHPQWLDLNMRFDVVIVMPSGQMHHIPHSWFYS